jgi:hypothetical protein
MRARGCWRALAQAAALAAALGEGTLAAQGTAAAPAGLSAAQAQAQELAVRRQESLLLHQKVDLRGLRRVDGPSPVVESPPVSRILIVHIWAVECRPCVEEFPVLRPILDSLRTLPLVKAVLISETQDTPKLQAFLRDNRSIVPQLPQYQVADDRLRASLQNQSQPVTLLLDERGVVRQAFLGSIRHRRSELADAVQRLVKSL